MEEIVIDIKSKAMVQPSEDLLKRSLWVSNADLVVSRYYSESIHFYRSDGSPGFFDLNVVKEALSRALVPYYPVAGRLRKYSDGSRIEIDCNNEGVLFVVAETDSVLDNFADFAPSVEYKKLVPDIDYTIGISSLPLFLVQLTSYKCGGISLGVANHHLLADGFSLLGFINSWASLALGLELATSPFIDRTVLRARDPPSPKFEHVEYDPCPQLLTPRPTNVALSTRAFNITRDLINALKANTTKNHTSFESISGHIWRCVCKARGLSDTQPSKLYIPVDARSRLEPKLPRTYFGNAIFIATPMALAGDIISNPTSYAADKIHESVARMDNEYVRSALDYIELHPDKEALARGAQTFKSPNLTISSVAHLPIYGADFGWGRPAFIRRGWVQREGICFLAGTGSTDGGLYLLITLEDEHMQHFETHLYNI